MATLKLTIKGRPGTISLRSFLQMANSSFGILSDLDYGIAGLGKGTLHWVVKDVSISSLALEIESRSQLPDKNFGAEVAKSFVNGLAQLEHEGTTPPFFTEASLEKAKRLIKTIGRDGATGFAASYMNQSADLSVQASANIEQLIGAQHHSIGSIEGKLETISIHGYPRFVLYHHITRRGVTCKIPSDMIESAKDSLGRRVIASGLVYYNSKGEPIRVEVDNLRVLRRENELPAKEQISGSDPELTGAMNTEAYLRYIRGG